MDDLAFHPGAGILAVIFAEAQVVRQGRGKSLIGQGVGDVVCLGPSAAAAEAGIELRGELTAGPKRLYPDDKAVADVADERAAVVYGGAQGNGGAGGGDIGVDGYAGIVRGFVGVEGTHL